MRPEIQVKYHAQNDVRPRLLTVSGPPGLDASEALSARAIILQPEDILIIAEHDMANEVQVDQHGAFSLLCVVKCD